MLLISLVVVVVVVFVVLPSCFAFRVIEKTMISSIISLMSSLGVFSLSRSLFM